MRLLAGGALRNLKRPFSASIATSFFTTAGQNSRLAAVILSVVNTEFTGASKPTTTEFTSSGLLKTVLASGNKTLLPQSLINDNDNKGSRMVEARISPLVEKLAIIFSRLLSLLKTSPEIL